MVNKYIAVISALLVFAGCTGDEKTKQKADDHFFIKIFETAGSGFGYDIYKDSSLMIHQPIVPSVSGNNGFRNKEDAEAVANLMVMKLENGIMPPSVTTRELDSINIER